MMRPHGNPTEDQVLYVLENARKKTRQEMQAMGLSPEGMAHALSRADGFHWVFYHNNKPAALLGVYPENGGLWSAYGAGTDDWIKVWRQVTLTAKVDMIRKAAGAGAHRIQCLSPASHTETHKWLRFIGANHVAELPMYGQDGTDFLMFSWLKPKSFNEV